MRVHTAFQSRRGSRPSAWSMACMSSSKCGGVEKAGLVLQGHLVAQALGPLDGDAGVPGRSPAPGGAAEAEV
jgi:hypothetical protein